MSLPSTLCGFSSKAYQSAAQACAWAQEVASALGDGGGSGQYVCVPYPLLPLMREWLDGTGMDVGVQDVSTAEPGPHTGDVTAELLVELGCRYVMLGHPERRHDHGESWEDVARKAGRTASVGMVPVVVAGDAHPEDDVAAVVREQLRGVLREVAPGADLVVAYEPAWAIGVAEAAPPSHVVRAVTAIRGVLDERPGDSRIVYGGSAKTGTYAAIAQAGAAEPRGVPDGVFLGRAGLEARAFLASVEEVAAVRR